MLTHKDILLYPCHQIKVSKANLKSSTSTQQNTLGKDNSYEIWDSNWHDGWIRNCSSTPTTLPILP